MSYNIDESFSYSTSGTRIRPAWRGLGLATGAPTAGSLSSETGIPISAAQKIIDKLFASEAGKELESTLADLFVKYVPADKQEQVSLWISRFGLSNPFIPKTPPVSSGGVDVTSKPLAPKESNMKILIPIALLGIGAFLMMKR